MENDKIIHYKFYPLIYGTDMDIIRIGRILEYGKMNEDKCIFDFRGVPGIPSDQKSIFVFIVAYSKENPSIEIDIGFGIFTQCSPIPNHFILNFSLFEGFENDSMYYMLLSMIMSYAKSQRYILYYYTDTDKVVNYMMDTFKFQLEHTLLIYNKNMMLVNRRLLSCDSNFYIPPTVLKSNDL